MPACSKAIHPSGVSIEFFEDNHQYVSVLNGKEIKYVSGTTFVHRFIPEFDPDGAILKRKAVKEGITPEELKRQWDEKRDRSCVYGTNIHSLCEDVLLNRDRRFIPVTEKEINTAKYAQDAALKFRQGLDILGIEKIVFSPYLPVPIAGTIDLLAKSRKGESILILDWKTNERIDTENKYGRFCRSPISDIPDLNFWHYSLQLSLYQYLLTFGKYVPAGSKFKRAIIHLTETGYKIYQLPDLTDRIKDMIIWDQCNFGIKN